MFLPNFDQVQPLQHPKAESRSTLPLRKDGQPEENHKQMKMKHQPDTQRFLIRHEPAQGPNAVCKSKTGRIDCTEKISRDWSHVETWEWGADKCPSTILTLLILLTNLNSPADPGACRLRALSCTTCFIPGILEEEYVYWVNNGQL